MTFAEEDFNKQVAQMPHSVNSQLLFTDILVNVQNACEKCEDGEVMRYIPGLDNMDFSSPRHPSL